MKNTFLCILAFLTLLLASCTAKTPDNQPKNAYITASSLLNITKGDGYAVVDISDPWNKGQLLERYVLVDSGAEPADLPAGTRINVPVTSAVVYSSVHSHGMDMIGALDAVTGVADMQYFTRLPNDRVVDIGSSMSPSIEKIITLAPQIIILSPYQNAGLGDVDRAGVPIVKMADYMENTPLGRAEWIKFLGLLFGREQQADSVYADVCQHYADLRNKVKNSKEENPLVLTEELTSGVWYVPGGNSYMANMLKDAGGNYKWANDTSTGSLQLSIEQVLSEAANSDIWLIRTFGFDESRDNMLAANELYRHFKPFNEDGIYCCNTAATNIFDLMAFRPDSVLAEYVSILHPKLVSTTPKFYKKIK